MTVRANPRTCTEIGPGCTIEGTLYGYYPNLPINSFFAAFFGLCFVIQLILGVRYKTWTFMIAMCLGCMGETAGYIGRVMLYNDPFSNVGFQMQICSLIMAPAYISAGIYLTLKHIVLNFGEEWSRVRPSWYTYIFIAGDMLSLILQGAGGGIAATSDPGSSKQDLGTNLMIAGVIFQVVILAFFAYFLGEYAIRTYRRRHQLTHDAMVLYYQKRFQFFFFAITLAFICILIRCIYRIPELTGGWRSELMRNELDFIVLEGVMIVISVALMTVAHPGYCFPALGNTLGKKNAMPKGKVLEDFDVEMISTR